MSNVAEYNFVSHADNHLRDVLIYYKIYNAGAQIRIKALTLETLKNACWVNIGPDSIQGILSICNMLSPDLNNNHNNI